MRFRDGFVRHSKIRRAISAARITTGLFRMASELLSDHGLSRPACGLSSTVDLRTGAQSCCGFLAQRLN